MNTPSGRASSRSWRLSLGLRLLALAACLAVALGCKREPGEPPAPKAPEQAKLEVRQVGENRYQSVLVITPQEPLRGVEIAFTLPAECRVVAGALARTFTDLPAGKSQDTALEFECTGGVRGKVSAAVRAAGNQPIDKTYEASF